MPEFALDFYADVRARDTAAVYAKLRAGILGANDGVISTAGPVVGDGAA